MTQMSYELLAKQQTSLTPRLQQSVKLLQMSTLDFTKEVAQAIANNPFLEDGEDTSSEEHAHAGAPAPKDAGHADGTDFDPPEQSAVGNADADRDTQAVEPAFDENVSTYSGDYPVRRDPDLPDTDVGQWAQHQTSMQESLLSDLCAYPLSERDRYLAEYIIEAIDDDGYLRLPFSELAPASAFSPPVDEKEWEAALRLVQQIATPGLAARNLQECLCLQLQALDEKTPGKLLATRIVSEHIDKLGRCDYAGLARVLECSAEDIQQATLLIRSLEPHPGRRYGAIDPSCYVVPDVIVRKVGKLWVAVGNESATPHARLNTVYAKLFRESRYGDRSLMAQALQEARWLLRSLEQRSSTIQRVAQAIVARQQTFFDYGEIALRPLMLSEIAEELGMHESTVSRATSHKYLSSPRGLFEFKHFFSRELATSSGGTCSAVAVRALIQEMIDEENPKEPLSDVTLARKLAREGVVVARRTVSKYRAQIKYPPAELRRAP